MNAESTTTCTVRMPQTLKNRLDSRANRLGVSLSQFIVDALEAKFTTVGLIEGLELRSKDRVFEISIEPQGHPPGMPLAQFHLQDTATGTVAAVYTIGFSQQYMWQLGIDPAEQQFQLREAGLALLHYLNRGGIDITRIEWSQFPHHKTQRVLQVQDAKTADGRFISSVEGFTAALKDENWVDRYDTEIEGTLEKFSNATTAVAVLPRGTQYSAALVSAQSAGAGIIDARAFDSISSLQSWLSTLNVEANKIPAVDFTTPVLIEVFDVPLQPPPQPREKVSDVLIRALKQASRNGSTVRFTTNDYEFKVNGNSSFDDEFGAYWDFQHTK